MDMLRSAGMSAEQVMWQINRMIDQQAYTRAADDIYLVSSGLFLLLIAMLWLTRRPARAPTGAGAAASGAH